MIQPETNCTSTTHVFLAERCVVAKRSHTWCKGSTIEGDKVKQTFLYEK